MIFERQSYELAGADYDDMVQGIQKQKQTQPQQLMVSSGLPQSPEMASWARSQGVREDMLVLGDLDTDKAPFDPGNTPEGHQGLVQSQI